MRNDLGNYGEVCELAPKNTKVSRAVTYVDVSKTRYSVWSRRRFYSLANLRECRDISKAVHNFPAEKAGKRQELHAAYLSNIPLFGRIASRRCRHPVPHQGNECLSGTLDSQRIRLLDAIPGRSCIRGHLPADWRAERKTFLVLEFFSNTAHSDKRI